MRTITITVTEAARNFADCINRARYQGTSFILHKNGVAVARIIPAGHVANESEPAENAVQAERAMSRDAVEDAVGRAPKSTVPEIW